MHIIIIVSELRIKIGTQSNPIYLLLYNKRQAVCPSVRLSETIFNFYRFKKPKISETAKGRALKFLPRVLQVF